MLQFRAKEEEVKGDMKGGSVTQLDKGHSSLYTVTGGIYSPLIIIILPIQAHYTTQTFGLLLKDMEHIYQTQVMKT